MSTRCHLCRRLLSDPLGADRVGPDDDGDYYCANFDACSKRALERIGIRQEDPEPYDRRPGGWVRWSEETGWTRRNPPSWPRLA